MRKKYQAGGNKTTKKPAKNSTLETINKVGEAVFNPIGAAIRAYNTSDTKQINDSLYRARQRNKKPQTGAATRKKGGAVKAKKK